MIQKLVAAGLIGSVAVAALAVQAPAMAGKDMSRADMQARVREHFGQLDKNRDGAIAKDELDGLAMRGGPGGPGEQVKIIRRVDSGGHDDMAMHGGPEHDEMMMEHHGRTGDGSATADGPGSERAFARLDTNRDGVISKDEFAKGREIRIERRIVRGGPEEATGGPGQRMKWKQRGGNGGGNGGGKGGGGMAGARMIAMSDSNDDGRITLAEAEAMAIRHFDQMDSNKDGKVTAEERRAGRPMMIKMRTMEHAPKAS